MRDNPKVTQHAVQHAAHATPAGLTLTAQQNRSRNLLEIRREFATHFPADRW